jgi:hypothetical protein
MVKVSIVVEGHDFAEVEFGGELTVHQHGDGSTRVYNPGEEKTVQVRGGEVPEAVLQKIRTDLSAGYRLGEYAQFKWQLIDPAS